VFLWDVRALRANRPLAAVAPPDSWTQASGGWVAHGHVRAVSSACLDPEQPHRLLVQHSDCALGMLDLHSRQHSSLYTPPVEARFTADPPDRRLRAAVSPQHGVFACGGASDKLHLARAAVDAGDAPAASPERPTRTGIESLGAVRIGSRVTAAACHPHHHIVCGLDQDGLALVTDASPHERGDGGGDGGSSS
jgi:hypothetical protein